MELAVDVAVAPPVGDEVGTAPSAAGAGASPFGGMGPPRLIWA